MTDDGLSRVVAAATAALGVYAVVTRGGFAAVLAGIGAVATAVLAVRRRPERSRDHEPSRPPEAIDLREMSADPAAAMAAADEVPVSSPQLLDERFLEAALRGRIAVARRALRPLSVVHVHILGSVEGDGPVPAGLVAAAAEATLRESDIVGRRSDGVYVVVLEDTGEDGAVWTTERLRRHIAGTIGPQRFQAGVASYPNHGLDAETVDASAARALVAAQEWDRDRIEVALH